MQDEGEKNGFGGGEKKRPLTVSRSHTLRDSHRLNRRERVNEGWLGAS